MLQGWAIRRFLVQAMMVWKVDELGNRLHMVWAIPRSEAEGCCLVVDIHGSLTDGDLEGEHANVSSDHVYVSDEHWQEHLAYQ